ncbi:MAG: Fe-S cluster assembly protein SufD [Acidimicrobiia bacterium]|nr:Fe-S cluster assembly protein SufD [Acidimicrobiia bacterium]
MTPIDSEALVRATGGEPEWRAAARHHARERVEGRAMPSNRDELWRYVDLGFELADYRLVDEPGAVPDSRAVLDGAPEVVVVDGMAVASSPSQGGLSVGSLATAVADGRPGLDTVLAPSLAADGDVFAAAHTAFGGDGAMVHAARNTTAQPVLVRLHTSTAGSISYPTVLVIAEENALASVVVDVTSDEVDAVTVPHIEVAAAPGATVRLSVVQHLGPEVRQIGTLRAAVDRDASAVLAEAGLGGSLARLHLIVDLHGRGSSATVNGVYFGDRSQVLDYRYFMHHAGLDTSSDMFLKGAVEDEALSVFTGLIRIDEGAQRTNAFQTNRNLILSDGAAAQSVPNLEILANDVKCGHASSVGPLDQEQRYYLMSRGLDPAQADRLQVRGFFEQALARFPHPEVTASLRVWINTKYVIAQQEGRV